MQRWLANLFRCCAYFRYYLFQAAARTDLSDKNSGKFTMYQADACDGRLGL